MLWIESIEIKTFIITAGASSIDEISRQNIEFLFEYKVVPKIAEQTLLLDITIFLLLHETKLVTLRTETNFKISDLNEFIGTSDLGELPVNKVLIKNCMNIAVHQCRGILASLLIDTKMKSVILPLINIDELVDESYSVN